MRILLVDDDAAMLRIISLALSRKGHAVSSADNGEGALAAVDQARPDVVLLDLGLPDMDGAEVCRRFRGRDIPVILVTAGADAAVDKARSYGALGCIAKPFDCGTLASTVEALLAKPR
ncbi:MAG: hypothetical protein A2X36_16510 [Elusimicrobia bacterium GWA2_69_24]|nr:MAG: hypothetical protein A2X36_16510 [Elusimicrobia bacterium GWA2_69_24]HBL18720.1 two-component system response regulator [Elusimicrobiota bacterium]